MATAKTTTEKKPAAAKKATASKPRAVAPAKPKAEKKTSASKSSSAERYKMIEVAAYFIAERDNFSGSAVDYWIAAEKQISKMLK